MRFTITTKTYAFKHSEEAELLLNRIREHKLELERLRESMSLSKAECRLINNARSLYMNSPIDKDLGEFYSLERYYYYLDQYKLEKEFIVTLENHIATLKKQYHRLYRKEYNKHISTKSV